jgi:ABC-2 type transport system ATP-binding protein
VIGKGRLIADMPTAQFTAAAAPATVRVRATDPAALAAVLRRAGTAVEHVGGGTLTVTGLTTDQVAMAAAAAGVTVLELTAQEASLEDAFTALTADAVEYRPTATTAACGASP